MRGGDELHRGVCEAGVTQLLAVDNLADILEPSGHAGAGPREKDNIALQKADGELHNARSGPPAGVCPAIDRAVRDPP